MPSVCRTVRTLPISAVSLPFSSSMMKRGPVPEVRASSFCVTPRTFRVSRTSVPMSCGLYFKASVDELPYGNILRVLSWKSIKYSRTGSYSEVQSARPVDVPAREQEALRPATARLQRTRSSIAEILGQVYEHRAFSDICNPQTMWVELSNLII